MSSPFLTIPRARSIIWPGSQQTLGEPRNKGVPQKAPFRKGPARDNKETGKLLLRGCWL